MRINSFTSAVRIGAVVALLGAMVFQSAQAEEEPGARRARRGFNLFASTFGTLEVNRVFCGINNLGEVCVDPTNSPGIGGGFWPKGTPNQYIFNSGLQLAGIISAPGFAWDGDTTGVFFMDPKGTESGGDPVSLVYNSLDPNDLASWPGQAEVWDPAIYSPVLLGRKTLAQQDLWVRTWDGNPNVAGGRLHPLGVLVEERGLAWNFPAGNEDIVYFVYNFYNISAKNRAVYNTLPAIVQDSVFAIAQDYISATEARFGVTFPADGYTVRDFYGAFFMDPDVGAATENYSSAILPFEMAIAYKSNWLEPLWSYPPGINGPPFDPSPGIVGVKYLRSPIRPGSDPPEEIGLTMFSNTLNTSTGFPDPDGVIQMWRYISGNISVAAGDNPCDFPDPKARGMCFLFQEEEDTRFYQSSGPFNLVPGEFSTIVVAYVHAAPVAAPLVASGEIGGDLKPLVPMTGEQIFAGNCTDNVPNVCIRTIDSIAGWLTHNDDNGNLAIDQDEIVSVKRSLLDKALVAQAVFDNKFLLPFAPEVPTFFLVAGDNTVSVVWQTSPSEATGDPFFAVASNPLSPLFDANFRQFDVEGYRVYRGRTSGQLQMLGTWDYTGTVFTDVDGSFWYGTNCMPEQTPPVLGGCPAFPNDIPIVGDLVQTRIGGRVQFIDLTTNLVATDPPSVDTAVTGGASGQFPELEDTGIPFAFVDLGVRNGFTYHYAVTAYDVNSFASGPSSLESARVTQTVRPRSTATNTTPVVLTRNITGDDGVQLDILAGWPNINAADGTFDGPVPPTHVGLLTLPTAVLEALPAGDITVRTDSVDGGFAGGFGPAPTLYYTMSAGDTVIPNGAAALSQPTFNAPQGTINTGSFSAPLVPYDDSASAILGLDFTQTVLMPINFTWTTIAMADASPSVATANGRYGVSGLDVSRYVGHSRWYDEGAAPPADPVITSVVSAANTAGTLTGVTGIWVPQGYRNSTANVNPRLRTVNASGMSAWYPADFTLTWGAGGTVTIRDVTHNVNLPFRQRAGSGYGFITLDSILAGGATQADLDGAPGGDGNGTPDINIISYKHLYFTEQFCSDWGEPCSNLSTTAQISALDTSEPPDGVADGNGIVLYVNGEQYFFVMSALPADGTEWHLKAITGVFGADCTPALGPVMTDCDNYTFKPGTRASIVPGLNYNLTVEQQFGIVADTVGDLDNVHTVPDPYYVTTSLEITPDTKLLQFVNLPNQAILRIYSLSGILVSLIEHNDPTGGGTATWDLRNRNSQIVASGVYFYHVETATGQEMTGRFTVVNFAQ